MGVSLGSTTKKAARTTKFAAGIVALGLVLSACGADSVDHEALVSALTSRDQMSNGEAVCVADVIYTEGAFSEENLKDAAADIESVPGFQDAVTAAIEACTG